MAEPIEFTVVCCEICFQCEASDDHKAFLKKHATCTPEQSV